VNSHKLPILKKSLKKKKAHAIAVIITGVLPGSEL
jgi:hypothetical protein